MSPPESVPHLEEPCEKPGSSLSVVVTVTLTVTLTVTVTGGGRACQAGGAG